MRGVTSANGAFWCIFHTNLGLHVKGLSIEVVGLLWNLGKPSKIRPTVSSRQNIPAV